MNPNTKKIAAATLSLTIGASLLGSMSASADELSEIEGIDTKYDKFGTITEEEDVIAAPANDNRIYLVPQSAEHSSFVQSADLVEDNVEVDLTIDNEETQIEDIDDNTDNIGVLDPNEEAVVPVEGDEGSYEIPVEAPVVEQTPEVEVPVIEDIVETPVVEDVIEGPVVEQDQEIVEVPVVEAPVVENVDAPVAEDVVELPGGDTDFDNEDTQIEDIDDNTDNIGVLDPDEEVTVPVEGDEGSYEIPVETPVVDETPEVEAPVVDETPEVEGVVETPVVEEDQEVEIEAPPAEDAPVVDAPIAEDVDELPGGDTNFDNEDTQIEDIDDNTDNIGVLDPDEEVTVPGEDDEGSYEIPVETPVVEETPEVEAPVVDETPEVEDVVETPVVEEVQDVETDAPVAEDDVELPGGDTDFDNEDTQIEDIDDNTDNIGVLDPDEEVTVPGEDDEGSYEIPVETPVVDATPEVEAPVVEDTVETPVVEQDQEIVDSPIVETPVDENADAPVAEDVVELPGNDTGVDNEDTQIEDIDDNTDNIGVLDPNEEAVVPDADDEGSYEIPVETPVVEETPDVDVESPVSEDAVEDTPEVEVESPATEDTPVVEVPSADVDADQEIVTPTPVESDETSDAEIVEEAMVNAPVESEPSNLNAETADAAADEVVTVNDETSKIDTVVAGSGANTDRQPTFNHVVDLSKVSADGSDYKDAMTFESEDFEAGAGAAVLTDVAESNSADASVVSESNESADVTAETLPDTGVESNPVLPIAAGIALIAGGAMVLNARRRAKSNSEL